MGRLDRAGKLHPDPKRLSQGKRSGPTDAGVQRILRVILHDEIGASGRGDADLQDVDDIGVAGQPAHRALLAQESIEIVSVETRRQHLHGDGPVK